jgi:hypothetical protein
MSSSRPISVIALDTATGKQLQRGREYKAERSGEGGERERERESERERVREGEVKARQY